MANHSGKSLYSANFDLSIIHIPISRLDELSQNLLLLFDDDLPIKCQHYVVRNYSPYYKLNKKHPAIPFLDLNKIKLLFYSL